MILVVLCVFLCLHHATTIYTTRALVVDKNKIEEVFALAGMDVYNKVAEIIPSVHTHCKGDFCYIIVHPEICDTPVDTSEYCVIEAKSFRTYDETRPVHNEYHIKGVYSYVQSREESGDEIDVLAEVANIYPQGVMYGPDILHQYKKRVENPDFRLNWMIYGREDLYSDTDRYNIHFIEGLGYIEFNSKLFANILYPVCIGAHFYLLRHE